MIKSTKKRCRSPIGKSCKRTDVTITKYFQPKKGFKHQCKELPEIGCYSPTLELYPVYRIMDRLLTPSSVTVNSNCNPASNCSNKNSDNRIENNNFSCKVSHITCKNTIAERIKSNIKGIQDRSEVRVSLHNLKADKIDSCPYVDTLREEIKNSISKEKKRSSQSDPENQYTYRQRIIVGNPSDENSPNKPKDENHPSKPNDENCPNLRELKDEIVVAKAKQLNDARDFINSLKEEILTYRVTNKSKYSCSCSALLAKKNKACHCHQPKDQTQKYPVLSSPPEPPQESSSKTTKEPPKPSTSPPMVTPVTSPKNNSSSNNLLEGPRTLTDSPKDEKTLVSKKPSPRQSPKKTPSPQETRSPKRIPSTQETLGPKTTPSPPVLRKISPSTPPTSKRSSKDEIPDDVDLGLPTETLWHAEDYGLSTSDVEIPPIPMTEHHFNEKFQEAGGLIEKVKETLLTMQSTATTTIKEHRSQNTQTHHTDDAEELRYLQVINSLHTKCQDMLDRIEQDSHQLPIQDEEELDELYSMEVLHEKLKVIAEMSSSESDVEERTKWAKTPPPEYITKTVLEPPPEFIEKTVPEQSSPPPALSTPPPTRVKSHTDVFSSKAAIVKAANKTLGVQVMPTISIPSGLVTQNVLQLSINPSGTTTNRTRLDNRNIGYYSIGQQVNSSATPSKEKLQDRVGRSYAMMDKDSMLSDMTKIVLTSYQVIPSDRQSFQSSRRNSPSTPVPAQRAPEAPVDTSRIVTFTPPKFDGNECKLNPFKIGFYQTKSTQCNEDFDGDSRNCPVKYANRQAIRQREILSPGSTSSEEEIPVRDTPPPTATHEKVVVVETPIIYGRQEEQADDDDEIGEDTFVSSSSSSSHSDHANATYIHTDEPPKQTQLDPLEKSISDVEFRLDHEQPEVLSSLLLESDSQESVLIKDENLQVSLSDITASSTSAESGHSLTAPPDKSLVGFIEGLTGFSTDSIMHIHSKSAMKLANIHAAKKSIERDIHDMRLQRQSSQRVVVMKPELYDESTDSFISIADPKIKNPTVMYVTATQRGRLEGGECNVNAAKASCNLPIYQKLFHKLRRPEVRKNIEGSQSNPIPVDESFSEGELSCKCSVSIGEVHFCKFGNEMRSSVKNIKNNPEKALQRKFKDRDLRVTRQRAQYNNWVTYYLSKGVERANDSSNEDLK